ncbi:MAG: hypothetical protein HKO81_10730, partial [Flavobacteriaceae bacterium]|nr:hypothetical protein [Flavobacteriaceae bacterium]
MTRRRFYVESIGLILIVLTPFFFKIHDYLPEDREATLNLFGYTLDRNGFNNVSTYVWFLLNKIIPLYLLIIWFFTCKHWWYHVILIPLCMYAFQLFEVIYSEDDYIETENILWLLPVCMVVITFVYFIRAKLYDKYVHGIDLEAMEAELQSFKEKESADHISQTVDSEGSSDKIDLSEKVSKRT